MFSLDDPVATNLQYHYTAPEVQYSQLGTNKVDADSIYRIASVSKLITVYAGLTTLKPQDWDRSLADIIPGLDDATQARLRSLNPTVSPQWDKITPRALATQLSGIATIGIPSADWSVTFALEGISDTLASFGLPPYNVSALGPCATNLIQNASNEFCSAPDAIVGIKTLPPNFLPWTNPSYSDQNFMLLGIAISNITGKPWSDVYQDSVFEPLGMTSSYDAHPTDSAQVAHSVIVGDFAVDWALETGFTTPSGGLLSTISDLSKLGIAIMNNTLIPADTTLQWMKPASHTASLSYSVGGPWEIHRYLHPNSSKVTDLYTKLGDSGKYGGTVVIIPQYNAGFTMLNAGTATNRPDSALVVLDLLTNTIVPALEAQAAAEAQQNYVGRYISSDPSLNASVTITFNASTVPGSINSLSLTEWTYNNTNLLSGAFITSLTDIIPRLEPSILKQTPPGTPGFVAFQASTNIQTATYTDAMAVPDLGVIGTWTGFYYSNFDWITTDGLRYGGQDTLEFIFDVDGEGKAVACTPAVQGVRLVRVGG